jgi:hypothetical protein
LQGRLHIRSQCVFLEGHCYESIYWKQVEAPKSGQAVLVESHKKVTSDFTYSKATAEIEDKSRLSDELAVRISHRLNPGIRITVPGWGRHSIRPLGVRRILDRYYDTPDRTFQTWSKANGKQLLLRDRQEGTVIGDVNLPNIQTPEEMSMIPVAGETHICAIKVPLEDPASNYSMRTAWENEATYTNQDRAVLRVQYL